MGLTITQVDAFTNKPFHGNPAAVCVLPAVRPDAWLQAVASEMNLSETAFLLPETDGFRLRWFTPAVEVDLCGHATLASAHVLWETGQLDPDQMARFHTRSGLLTARRTEGGIELDFPATPSAPAPALLGLVEALHITPLYVGKTRFDYLIEVADEATVRAMRPNYSLLATLGVRGVMVTSRGADGYDFVSRFFAPGSGIDEDPVTGSAHCALAPFWSERLHKQEFRAYQASARGGELGVRLNGDRVYLTGQAVTVLRGELVEHKV